MATDAAMAERFAVLESAEREDLALGVEAMAGAMASPVPR